MFTGIIEAQVNLSAVKPTSDGVRFSLDAHGVDIADVKLGDSIAVDGVCLTVVAINAGRLDFDVSRETLNCTKGFTQGAHVNVEKSLRLADRLGGHWVSGHVDAVGTVQRLDVLGENHLLAVSVPPELSKYIARKGSITVNGVSLTVNTVTDATFEVNLIPHTFKMTNLGGLAPDARVNLEVDMLARYVERILAATS